jgi:hypothetical protein
MLHSASSNLESKEAPPGAGHNKTNARPRWSHCDVSHAIARLGAEPKCPQCPVSDGRLEKGGLSRPGRNPAACPCSCAATDRPISKSWPPQSLITSDNPISWK